MLDALEVLVENLRKECYAKFAGREAFQDLARQTEALEARVDQLEQRADNTDNSLA
jgi:hypothetical protein